MASYKRRDFPRTRFNPQQDMVISSLKKENANLKNALVELSRQHSEHNKLVERFLSLASVRLENFQQKKMMSSEPPNKREGALMNGDAASDERTSAVKITELQNVLTDALEKNKRWLEYDQQREAYVRAVLDRMLWLKKQLSEANNASARSQQHNKEHSEEKDRIVQMQEHYEKLLEKAKDELEVLREQVNMTQQNLITTQNWCKEREGEVEELKQELQSDKVSSRKIALKNHHCSGDEEQPPKEQSKVIHALEEEKRRSANFELQANLTQQYMLSRYHADQEKIEHMKRQIKISSQDLEDEKQDCLYLKKQMVKVLKKLQKTKDHVTKQSKSEQQERPPSEALSPPCLTSLSHRTSSPRRSSMNESFLECPGCRAEYRGCDYRELMNHLEECPQLS